MCISLIYQKLESLITEATQGKIYLGGKDENLSLVGDIGAGVMLRLVFEGPGVGLRVLRDEGGVRPQ